MRPLRPTGFGRLGFSTGWLVKLRHSWELTYHTLGKGQIIWKTCLARGYMLVPMKVLGLKLWDPHLLHYRWWRWNFMTNFSWMSRWSISSVSRGKLTDQSMWCRLGAKWLHHRCKLVQLSMWTLAPTNSASWKVAAEKRFNPPCPEVLQDL